MSLVDFRPLIDTAFAFVDQLVLAVAVPALTLFALRKLHVDTAGALAARVLSAADNAAAVGLSRAQAAADAHGVDDVKSTAIAQGVGYLNTAFTQATLARAGLTPLRLSQLVEARIAAAAPVLALPQPSPQEKTP
jgi:hypothetical protein